MAGNGFRREVTMADVARLADVSITTVSHVVNRTRRVSTATERAVLSAVAETGYVPDDVVRSLRTTGSRTIGLAISAISNTYFGDLVRSAERALSRTGYSLLLADTHDDELQELRAMNELLMRRVDAVLLAPSANPRRVLEYARQRQVPVVVIDRSADDNCDQIIVENIESTAALVEHLVRHGRRRIAMISGKPGLSTTDERILGFKRGLRAAGVRLRPDFLISGDSTVDGGFTAANTLLALARPPEALLVGNNAMTIGAVHATRDRGIQISEDLALVAFDDFEWADFFRPRLTVMAQPLQAMGEHAANMILSRLGDLDAPARRLVLRAELRRRESCGCDREALPLTAAAPESIQSKRTGVS